MAKIEIDLPSNADMGRPKPQKVEKNDKIEDHHVKKVVKGSVKKVKKPLTTKFKEAFLPDDVENVGEYLIYDILVPNMKDLFYDMIMGGLEMKLWGSVASGSHRRPNGRKPTNGSIFSYDKISQNNHRPSEKRSSRRSNYIEDDIILETRGEAEECISLLCDIIEEYGQATVADLMEMLNQTGQYTDNYWGWDDMSSSSVKRTRDGYMLILPSPKNLR